MVAAIVVVAAVIINLIVVVEVLVTGVRTGVVIDTLVGVEIVVAASVIALEFTMLISYFVDVLSDMLGAALIDTLTGMGFVSDSGVEVFADINGSVFASLMNTLESAVPKI